jgi:hypothetical protein
MNDDKMFMYWNVGTWWVLYWHLCEPLADSFCSGYKA